jgi:hypothetical protein
MKELLRKLILVAALACGFFHAPALRAVVGPTLLSSYTANVVFADPLGSTSMTIAFDGTYYWSSTGDSTSGVRYAQIGSNGTLVQTFSPGLDFRSVFVNPKSPGTVYARQYSNGTIYQQTSAGVFTATSVSLPGLDAQSSVVFNGAGDGFLAMNNGVVSKFNLSGSLLGTVNLAAWGSNGENNYPQNRGIAAVGNYWFTYSAGTLAVWDTAGAKIGTTTLVGAGTSFSSNFSLSAANGMIFISDGSGGSWRGYKIGDFSAIPEPEAWELLGGGGLMAALFRWRRNRRG